MNLNLFILTGNVTRDPELRRTSKGTARTTFTIASDLVWYDDDGNKHEQCDFIPVTTYGPQAERDAKYLRKGSPVAVEGRLGSWWKPADKRGGYTFTASRVQYFGKGQQSTSPAATSDPDRDAWIRDYDRASGQD